MNADPIVIKGELNFNTIADFYAKNLHLIQSKSNPDLQIDLKNVTNCDTASLVLLLAWMRDAKRLKKSIHFTHVPKKLLDIASISGLKDLWIS